MFTGLVEEIGKTAGIKKENSGAALSITSSKILGGSKVGDSINVNGVCLTITKIEKNGLQFEIMKETLLRTNLKFLKKGSLCNLERALLANSRLGGHFVTGHIDAMSKIIKNGMINNSWTLEIETPKDLSKLIVGKGSVAVNGVSLTVGDVKKSSFLIYLIPHTLNSTNLKNLSRGELVNIETDLLGKYALNNAVAPVRIDKVFLKKHGF